MSSTIPIAARLVDAGMSPAEAEAKTALFGHAQLALAALGASEADARLWWVPGRIEFLGKHTDYAGGRSLLCACERGFAVVAVPRIDTRIRVRDARAGETVEGQVSGDLVVPADHWANYPLTVARRVARNFPGGLRGADVAFASDLPRDAGLSSSSALMIASFLALSSTNDLPSRPEYREAIRGDEDLAAFLGAVENGQGFRSLAGDRGVGTQGGSEDHVAILCGRPGAFVQYSFAPVRFERTVPFPPGHALVIGSSGVHAAKTGNARNAYNLQAERVAVALSAWRQATGRVARTLAAALDESPDAFQRLHDAVCRCQDPIIDAADVLHRIEQFRAESMEIVPAAGDALLRGDLERLGALVDESQRQATHRLGNQEDQTVGLARAARQLGAIAASAFGAGFGGSVYALVRERDAPEFTRSWSRRYAEEFPPHAAHAMFFTTRAGPPVTRL